MGRDSGIGLVTRARVRAPRGTRLTSPRARSKAKASWRQYAGKVAYGYYRGYGRASSRGGRSPFRRERGDT